jgi:hypothetical protein
MAEVAPYPWSGKPGQVTLNSTLCPALLQVRNMFSLISCNASNDSIKAKLFNFSDGRKCFWASFYTVKNVNV